jgi:hypothetical protein
LTRARRPFFFYARVADACCRFLAASWLGAETDGAAFTLYGNSVLLWKRHENLADEPALEKAINAFLPALIEWQEKLAQTTDSGSSASAGIGVRAWASPCDRNHRCAPGLWVLVWFPGRIPARLPLASVTAISWSLGSQAKPFRPWRRSASG